MYDELLRVPLLVDDPTREPATVDRHVSLIDIFPTICDSLGLSKPEKLQGEILYDPDSGEVEFATSSGGSRLACRTPEWKCLWHVEEDSTELYDLNADPDEESDVSEEHPDVVERLRGMLEDLRDEAAATAAETPEVDESEEARERLRALGYVDE